MIGSIDGSVIHRGAEFLVIQAGGIGYKVFCTTDTLAQYDIGSTAFLWTHLAVREQALDLYGFADRESLRFFELLLGVSGIGPKSALATLSIATVETMRTAIAEGNPSYLTKVAGIGKKTAEKIVLELQEKIGAAPEGETGTLRGDTDALEALHTMGYTLAEARDALRRVPREIEQSNDRLREALKILGS